ncbi:MAG: PD-(D/E)XK nuclease family protein [Thermoplasmata archaeon]
MAPEGEGKHVFYSSGGARVFSLIYDLRSQGIEDLIKEVSSSVGIKILSEEERVVSLIRAGSPVEELNTVRSLLKFLKLAGKISFMHKVIASDTSEKVIEKYSEVLVNYYKIISSIGKSEIEDFSEFLDLFPVKREIFASCISHLPDFFIPYRNLFGKTYQLEVRRKTVRKLKFPDYLSEIRWIVRDAITSEGRTCIIVPDDYFMSAFIKEMELYGTRPVIASDLAYSFLNDSPFLFLYSSLNCIYSDYSYDSMISLIENPYSKVNPAKGREIKQIAYDKNVMRGIDDWKTLFGDLGLSLDILFDLQRLSEDAASGKGLEALQSFAVKYLGDNPVVKITNILSTAFGGASSDIQEMINYLQALKYLPKVSIPGNGSLFLGRAEDLIGIPFDRVYISGLDSSSSLREFPDVARSLLIKLGLAGEFDVMKEKLLRAIIEPAAFVILTRSELDEKLSFTESIPFYDSVQEKEEYVSRDSIFVPAVPLNEWETMASVKAVNRYSLSQEIVKTRLEKPIYPTSLENYIGCHFKGFVNWILGIDEIEEPMEFLDPRNTGSLTHKILEKFYSTDISPREFYRLADSFVKNEIGRERYISRKQALKFYREKYVMSGRLTQFFNMDVSHAIALGRRTIHREFHFPSNGNSVAYEFDGKRISIGGFVDRIDEEGDNLCIIDYKSSLYGYPKNDLCDEEHGKVQLFFYKIGVESILGRKVKAAAYVSFRDVREGYATAGFYQEIPNENAQMKKCGEIVDAALRDFISGDCDPVVKEGGSLWKCENQLFCPLLSVCRVQERRW